MKSEVLPLLLNLQGSTQVFASADWDGKEHALLTVEGMYCRTGSKIGRLCTVCLSDSCVNQFVKLVSATPSQVLSVITGPERRALQAKLAQLDADEASEQCFIEVALKDLEVCRLMCVV